MFINLSNHASDRWSEEQLNAAREYGEIVDMQFPNVDPRATTEDLTNLAREISDSVIEQHPDCVMCQGESGLAFEITRNLQEEGIKVVSACSERKTVERQLEDGRTEKTAVFEFVQFREYPNTVSNEMKRAHFEVSVEKENNEAKPYHIIYDEETKKYRADGIMHLSSDSEEALIKAVNACKEGSYETINNLQAEKSIETSMKFGVEGHLDMRENKAIYKLNAKWPEEIYLALKDNKDDIKALEERMLKETWNYEYEDMFRNEDYRISFDCKEILEKYEEGRQLIEEKNPKQVKETINKETIFDIARHSVKDKHVENFIEKYGDILSEKEKETYLNLECFYDRADMIAECCVKYDIDFNNEWIRYRLDRGLKRIEQTLEIKQNTKTYSKASDENIKEDKELVFENKSYEEPRLTVYEKLEKEEQRAKELENEKLKERTYDNEQVYER